MPYVYHTVGFPTIRLQSTDTLDYAAAEALSEIIAQNATDGYEFYSIERISVYRPPGCIAKFFMKEGDYATINVAVFRKAIA